MKTRIQNHAITLIQCLILILIGYCQASFCGNNKVPFGIEIYKNGQPVFLCSKPNCFDKTFADCDERAVSTACHSKSGWVGGFDKSIGFHQPLYVQCCELDGFDTWSDPIHTNVPIKPGEYFEGDEIQGKEEDDILAFDMITNISLVQGKRIEDLHYMISVRRFRCNDMIRPKMYKPWKWP